MQLNDFISFSNLLCFFSFKETMIAHRCISSIQTVKVFSLTIKKKQAKAIIFISKEKFTFIHKMGFRNLIFIAVITFLVTHSAQSAALQSSRQRFCICTREYYPICASNQHTYSNRCQFRCEQRWNPDLQIIFFGKCDENY